MKKKGVVILCAAAAAVIGLVCWRMTGRQGEGADGGVVYVNSVAKLTGLGSGNGMINRFAGVVESQDTWSVQQNPEKTVKEGTGFGGAGCDGGNSSVYLRYRAVPDRTVPGAAGSGTDTE